MLGGKYEVVDHLGDGAFARTLKCSDKDTGKEYAIICVSTKCANLAPRSCTFAPRIPSQGTACQTRRSSHLPIQPAPKIDASHRGLWSGSSEPPSGSETRQEFRPFGRSWECRPSQTLTRSSEFDYGPVPLPPAYRGCWMCHRSLLFPRSSIPRPSPTGAGHVQAVIARHASHCCRRAPISSARTAALDCGSTGRGDDGYERRL